MGHTLIRVFHIKKVQKPYNIAPLFETSKIVIYSERNKNKY